MEYLNKDIQKTLPALPDETGVYLMKDLKGNIIYIGKASSIRKRVSSYFRKNEENPRVGFLVKNIRKIDYIVTDSEIEALILESSLIKKHKPKYNIRLKDDKKYPYIAVLLVEKFPRVIFTRKLQNNLNRYFGPYTDAKAARKMVSMVNTTFKIKTCKKNIPLKNNERPCLNYQMKRCAGVCQGTISREEYVKIIDNAIKFLDGNIEPLINDLRNIMEEYSKKLEYEKAAQIRDIIIDIKKISEKQKVYAPIGMDQDYIGISIQKNEAVILLFEFRTGILLGKKISIFENTQYYDPGEIIKSFIINYYQKKEPPPLIITQQQFDDKLNVEKFLTKNSSRKVKTFIPRSKTDKSIINMIHKNLAILISERIAHEKHLNKNKGLLELKKMLGLKSLPERIECFDISNIQGKYAVGSMVLFMDGTPHKSGYRRYRIKSYDSPNDPGMIHEIVGRRLQYLINENIDLPNLIIIDGGRSQLGRANEAANALEIDVKIISIAKKFEEIYTETLKEPIKLMKTSPALKIIQNIRDEAHRFAIDYHKKVRDKKIRESLLESIPNIGEKKKKLLLQNLKTIENIKNSSLRELERAPGIGVKTAKEVYDFFHKNQ